MLHDEKAAKAAAKAEVKEMKRQAFLRRKAEEEAAAAAAAHAEWVAVVEALPPGPLRAAEEAWGLREVMAAAQWGGGLAPAETFRRRIAAIAASA